MTKIMKISGYLFGIMAVAIIVTLRILGINFTEGQLLINYWPYWLLAVVSGISSIYFLIYREYK